MTGLSQGLMEEARKGTSDKGSLDRGLIEGGDETEAEDFFARARRRIFVHDLMGMSFALPVLSEYHRVFSGIGDVASTSIASSIASPSSSASSPFRIQMDLVEGESPEASGKRRVQVSLAKISFESNGKAAVKLLIPSLLSSSFTKRSENQSFPVPLPRSSMFSSPIPGLVTLTFPFRNSSLSLVSPALSFSAAPAMVKGLALLGEVTGSVSLEFQPNLDTVAEAEEKRRIDGLGGRLGGRRAGKKDDEDKGRSNDESVGRNGSKNGGGKEQRDNITQTVVGVKNGTEPSHTPIHPKDPSPNATEPLLTESSSLIHDITESLPKGFISDDDDYSDAPLQNQSTSDDDDDVNPRQFQNPPIYHGLWVSSVIQQVESSSDEDLSSESKDVAVTKSSIDLGSRVAVKIQISSAFDFSSSVVVEVLLPGGIEPRTVSNPSSSSTTSASNSYMNSGDPPFSSPSSSSSSSSLFPCRGWERSYDTYQLGSFSPSWISTPCPVQRTLRDRIQLTFSSLPAGTHVTGFVGIATVAGEWVVPPIRAWALEDPAISGDASNAPGVLNVVRV